MIVFKNYFKIIKKHLGIIIMYSAISIVIAVANTSYHVENGYINIESKVAIIDHDNSKLTNNFIEYMENNSKKVEVNENAKDIQDALYNNKADAILIIPEHFTEDLLKGNDPTIEIKKSTQNLSEIVELMVNKYYKIANIYSKIGMSEDEIIEKVTSDLEKQIEVKVSSEQNVDELTKVAFFYSFQTYAFLTTFIFVIGTIMCVFNKETINKRNSISNMKPKEFSKQLFMGHISITLILWAIFVAISFILYKETMCNIYGLLLIINSLIFAITVTSMAYLIGTLVKNQNVLSGIQNIVGLGLCFISGCFVGMELLDKNILNFAKLFPAYWFIYGNQEIVKIAEINAETIKPVIQNYGIILAFGIVYFIISRIIIKKRVRK